MTMRKPTCPTCKLRPKKPASGYCIECNRAKQRARYRQAREEAGFEVYGQDEREADLEAEKVRWTPEAVRARLVEEFPSYGPPKQTEAEMLAVMAELSEDPLS